MPRLAVFLLVALLCGCASKSLGPEWEPLEQIRESKTLTIGLGDHGARTIGETVYVKDLDKWLELHPEPLYSAMLTHERAHAQRQKSTGVFEWVGKYSVDRDFMWKEEQIGYYHHIQYLRTHGQGVNAAQFAKNMSKYKNLQGDMVSFADAYTWIQDVLSGAWEPPQ